MNTNNKNPGQGDQPINLGWLALVPEAWAISLQAFLHTKFGERFLGLQAGLVVVLIPFYCILWPHDDLRPMLMFLLAYLFMCLMARFGMLVRRVRGELPQHSRYPGYPRLMKLFPRLSELTVKRYVEPLLAFVAGALMLPLNQPLGGYLMIGAACMFIIINTAVVRVRNQATDMYDSVLDQQDLAEKFRNMRGDDF